MKTHRLPILALLISLSSASGSSEDRLCWRVEEGAGLARSFRSSYRLASEELSSWIGGEEVPSAYLPELEVELRRSLSLEVGDRILAVAEGRPAELLRTFEALEEEEMQSFRMPPQTDEQGERVGRCELVGSSVLFRWDEQAQDYRVSHPDESEDPELEGLVEDLGLRAWLPEEDPGPGASWEIDAELVAALQAPAGELPMRWSGAGFEERDGEPEWSGELVARYVEHDEEQGLARIALAGELILVETRATDLEHVPVAEGDATETSTTYHRVEGTLLWDLEAGHMRSLELRCDLAVDSELVRDEGQPGPSFESLLTFRGEWVVELEVEPAD
jgi:hypothetical protein